MPSRKARKPLFAALTVDECGEVLGRNHVGRLAFLNEGIVDIEPVHYIAADSWIFVGSMLATFAMARGWVDFWLCWIAVDLVGVPLLLHSHFYPSAVLYAVYGAFVVWGFVTWLRIARTEAEPVGGAAARPDEVRA